MKIFSDPKAILSGTRLIDTFLEIRDSEVALPEVRDVRAVEGLVDDAINDESAVLDAVLVARIEP